MMTDKLFYTIFGDAIASPDRDTFVSDWSLSSSVRVGIQYRVAKAAWDRPVC